VQDWAFFSKNGWPLSKMMAEPTASTSQETFPEPSRVSEPVENGYQVDEPEPKEPQENPKKEEKSPKKRKKRERKRKKPVATSEDEALDENGEVKKKEKKKRKKKPSKKVFERRNIKTLLTDDKLEASTLDARVSYTKTQMQFFLSFFLSK
jgi:hypothetical protein